MSGHDDQRLLRFARGELRGAELEALEAELDADPKLREALGHLLSPENAPTEVSEHKSSQLPVRNDVTLGRELGRGGMAVVLLAVQHGIEREVAVKRLRGDAPFDDGSLIQEARLTGALEHPAVVPVHFLTTDEQGRAMVVLKRVEGEAWSGLLRHPEVVEARFRRPALEWHLRVLSTVCDALAFAHARGVIHRDVKPANVMVGTFGEVYLTDWGLGGLLTADPVRGLPCVADSPGAGTPSMMAPEQRARGALSFATDVWLVGACLYEVLYGRPPLAEAIPAPVFSPGPRPDVLAVAQRALAEQPEARFGSIVELKQALEGCLRHTDSERLAAKAVALQHAAVAQREATGDADSVSAEAAHTFRAALELWPDNPSAKQAAADLTGLRVAWALADEQPALAQTLLKEHPHPPVALAQQVTDAVAEASRLQAHARGMDPDIGQRQRVTFLGGVVVMMVVFNSARLMWPSFYESRWSLALSSVAFLVGFVALGLAHRPLLTSSNLNQQLARLVFVTTLAQISSRTTAAVLGWTRGQALTVDLSVIALTLMIGAAVFHWSFGVGAVVCLAGQALALTFPAAAEPLFGATSVLAIAGVALGLRFWRKAAPT